MKTMQLVSDSYLKKERARIVFLINNNQNKEFPEFLFMLKKKKKHNLEMLARKY